MAKKKKWTPEQKMEIVLEVLKGERMIGEIASQYGVHPTQIHRWRNELLQNADKIFAPSQEEKAAAQAKKEQEELTENLYAQIGRLTTQLDWLKKKSGG